MFEDCLNLAHGANPGGVFAKGIPLAVMQKAVTQPPPPPPAIAPVLKSAADVSKGAGKVVPTALEATAKALADLQAAKSSSSAASSSTTPLAAPPVPKVYRKVGEWAPPQSAQAGMLPGNCSVPFIRTSTCLPPSPTTVPAPISIEKRAKNQLARKRDMGWTGPPIRSKTSTASAEPVLKSATLADVTMTDAGSPPQDIPAPSGEPVLKSAASQKTLPDGSQDVWAEVNVVDHPSFYTNYRPQRANPAAQSLKSVATAERLDAPYQSGDGGREDFTEAELAEIDVRFGSVDHKDEQYESVWVQNPYPSDDPLDALKELPPAPEDTEEVYSEWTQRRLIEYATEKPTVLTQDESDVILEEIEENRKQRPRPQLASDGVPVPDGEGHFVFCLACFDNGKETVVRNAAPLIAR